MSQRGASAREGGSINIPPREFGPRPRWLVRSMYIRRGVYGISGGGSIICINVTRAVRYRVFLFHDEDCKAKAIVELSKAQGVSAVSFHIAFFAFYSEIHHYDWMTFCRKLTGKKSCKIWYIIYFRRSLIVNIFLLCGPSFAIWPLIIFFSRLKHAPPPAPKIDMCPVNGNPECMNFWTCTLYILGRTGFWN